MVRLGGTPPIIRVIQGGPVDEHWDSKHHWQAISQERSDVEKIGMEQYSFVLGTMEPIDGVVPHDEYRDEMDMMTVSRIISIVQL